MIGSKGECRQFGRMSGEILCLHVYICNFSASQKNRLKIQEKCSVGLDSQLIRIGVTCGESRRVSSCLLNGRVPTVLPCFSILWPFPLILLFNTSNDVTEGDNCGSYTYSYFTFHLNLSRGRILREG